MTERDKRLEAHAERLRMNPQIAALPEEAVTALARRTRLIRFESGDRILSRGDEIRYAGVILRGGIRSSINGYDGHELSISIMRRGAFYGWMGILEPTPSPWDIYAHGATEFACIFCSDFRAVMKDHPALLRMLAQALNLRLRRAYDYMTNLVLDDLEVRLRKALVMLAGDRTLFSDETLPRIRITQEALGHFVQCSRPTVNKMLKDLEKRGLVELGYGEIVLCDMAALMATDPEDRMYLL